MSGVQLEVTTLIESLKFVEPRIYQALSLLNKQLESIRQDLDPLIVQSVIAASGVALIDPPGNFTALATGTIVRFTWTAATGATSYEIRKGADWNTATFQLKTNNLHADIDPLLYGSHTYLIKSIDSAGNYSLTSSQVIFVVNQIPAPTITVKTIDNNVLLNWTIPTSQFNIKHYIIKKDAVQTGLVTSTFTAFFELVSGTYVYSVIAVDIAGNVGTEATIAGIVNQPPDYALQDSRISALGGTRVNVILLTGPKLLANWLTETFQVHFTGRTWLTPQNQVDAGYPIYIQPAATTGSYEEVIDYGTILSNVIAVITYTKNLITSAADVTVLVRMAVSDDGISYSAFTNGAAQFFSSVRFLKFRLEFTGASDKALAEFYEVKIDISVKRENDGGEIAAISTDANGTEVTFNKAFKDVETLTATVKSTTKPFVTVIRFVDIPNPVSFFVYAFDTTGNRVSKTVEWKARGII